MAYLVVVRQRAVIPSVLPPDRHQGATKIEKKEVIYDRQIE